MGVTLHWFRNDLRLHDNPALHHACQNSGEDIVTCYILAPEQWQEHDWSPAKIGLLTSQLTTLQTDLEHIRVPLVICAGKRFSDQIERLIELVDQLQVTRLVFNEEYAINERLRDREVTKRLQDKGVQVERFRDQSILPVGDILTQQDKPYTVFSPFKRNWLETSHQRNLAPLPPPSKREPPSGLPDRIKSITQADVSAYVRNEWPAGNDEALSRLDRFREQAMGAYHRQRDYPAIDGTSQLSPYLALGILSGRQCLASAREAINTQPSKNRSEIDAWINELIWRDFYIHILYHFSRVSRHRAFRPETDQLAWNGEGDHFTAWCEGRTGIPIVDAAMRQLRETGWMHNRLRMIVAMFLTKNLFIDWRLGERFFMQHLADGYLPANNGGWQWSASTGTDAAPYFRIFNPVSQSQKFDPHGEFIRRYVPEIARRDDRTIHLPLEKPLPGIDYPTAIVDLKRSRQAAIDRFKALSKSDNPDSVKD